MTLTQLILIFSAAFSTSVITTDEAAHLKWKTHYGNAKRTAQAAKRPLVVVIEDSKQSEKQIDEKSLVGDSRKKLANQDFELVRVDANTDYGKRVAKAFGVREFPYTAVTDDVSERIVFRKSGPMTKADWTLALATSSETQKVVQSPPPYEEQIVTEQVIVQRPIQGTVVTYPQSQPATPNSPSTFSAPQPAYQPIISPQMFAPNGLYQLPASQCVT